jgi:hypothetical protein
VRVETLGSPKCRNVGESQSLLMMTNPMMCGVHVCDASRGGTDDEHSGPQVLAMLAAFEALTSRMLAGLQREETVRTLSRPVRWLAEPGFTPALIIWPFPSWYGAHA